MYTRTRPITEGGSKQTLYELMNQIADEKRSLAVKTRRRETRLAMTGTVMTDRLRTHENVLGSKTGRDVGGHCHIKPEAPANKLSRTMCPTCAITAAGGDRAHRPTNFRIARKT